MIFSTDKTFCTLKRMSNIFFPHTFSTITLVYVLVPSIVVETLFRDILRIICHIGFKCGSVNLHKQKKQPTKYQHLDTAPLPTVKQLVLQDCKYIFLLFVEFEMCSVFPGVKPVVTFDTAIASTYQNGNRDC